MIEYVVDDAWHGEAICRGINKDMPFRPGYDRCLAITRSGKFMGGVLYDNWHQVSIQMHVSAVDRSWLTREFLYRAFDYPFNQLKVNKIYAPVESYNTHAMQFDLRLGFVEEVRLVGAVPDGDLVVLSMTRHQCKWLRTSQ